MTMFQVISQKRTASEDTYQDVRIFDNQTDWRNYLREKTPDLDYHVTRAYFPAEDGSYREDNALVIVESRIIDQYC